MRKLRLALHKGEELRFLSHLDYAQAVMRMIRRAHIKMAYSEGFNPHMKISFSSALALGVTAFAEYMDMDVLEEASVEDIIKRLQKVAPKGLEVLGGKEIDSHAKKMMAICNYATYVVEGTVVEEAAWEDLVNEFNTLSTIPYEKVTPKKTKTLDMKDYVIDPLRYEVGGDRIRIHMGIGIYPHGTIKPSEVWQYLRTKLHWPIREDYAIHREGIWVLEGGVRKTPLEV